MTKKKKIFTKLAVLILSVKSGNRKSNLDGIDKFWGGNNNFTLSGYGILVGLNYRLFSNVAIEIVLHVCAHEMT